MSSRTASQRQRELATKLRVSQIAVNLVLINEHDAPTQADPVVFTGDENGTAAENLMGWLAKLPQHLEVAAAQLSNGSVEEDPDAA